MSGEPEVVLYAYAKGWGSYQFVPERCWEERSRVMQAFFTARTWGEFWSLLPEAEAARLRRGLEERAEEWEPEDAARFRPRDDDGFDPRVLPGVEDGEYPDQLSVLAIDWFPRELLRDLDSVTGGPGSGLFLTMDGDGGPLPDVEATFARHGYRLVWDEERALKASGWWWDQVSMGRRPG